MIAILQLVPLGDTIACGCGRDLSSREPVALVAYPVQTPVLTPLCIDCATVALLEAERGALSRRDTEPVLGGDL